MPRYSNYLFVWAALGVSTWAQTTPNSTHIQVAGILPVIDRSTQQSSAPARPAKSASSSETVPFNGIQYWGGPVMNDPRGVNAYYIWYGNWSDSEVPPILTDFIENIGGTAYWNINSSYYDFTAEGEKDPIKNRVNYKGSTFDNYSYGSSLSDDDIGFILEDAINSGRLPYDLNGAYFVLTSADVTETSGFCVSYCAWHGWDSLANGDNLIVSFIGNPDQCRQICTPEPQLPTPNNSVAADGMANAIAHELSESVTDPLGTGWINPDGSEDGDLCAWTFGKIKQLPNGSYYNLRFGGRPYLIQRLWVNARGGYCALALDE